MSDIISFTESKLYRFDFGCDEKIYSTQFMGEIPPEADTGILKEVRKHLLKESSAIICSFLEDNNINYFGFASSIKTLEHDKIIEQADYLLNSSSCNSINECLSKPSIYYASMDCQKYYANSHCKGCYYVIKKMAAAYGKIPHYKIIGQSFEDNKGSLCSCFAIRENRNGLRFFDIAKICNEPVFPFLGCVDTINLLTGIDHITTIEQVKNAAIY